MRGLTKRNLIAILIIIAFVTVSVLAWFYFPVVVFPLILALGAFSLAVYVALNPPGTGRVRPAVRIMATAGGPRPRPPGPRRGEGAGPGAARAGRPGRSCRRTLWWR